MKGFLFALLFMVASTALGVLTPPLISVIVWGDVFLFERIWTVEVLVWLLQDVLPICVLVSMAYVLWPNEEEKGK